MIDLTVAEAHVQEATKAASIAMVAAAEAALSARVIQESTRADAQEVDSAEGDVKEEDVEGVQAEPQFFVFRLFKFAFLDLILALFARVRSAHRAVTLRH